MNLRTRLLVAFLAISMIPIFIITLFTYDRYTSLVTQQTSQVADNIFSSATEHLNDSIDIVKQVHQVFTLYSPVGEDSIIENIRKYRGGQTYTMYDIFISNKQIQFACQSLIFSQDNLNGIFLFTPSGVTLGYGYGGNIDIYYDYDASQDKWYQDTLELNGGIYVDGVTTKDYIISAKPSITFTTALYDTFSHEFLGVLMVDCKPEIFNLDSVNTLPDIMYLTVQNEETGYVLYSNLQQLPPKGEDIVTRKTELALSNLSLVGVVDNKLLYNEFDQTRFVIILIAAICAVFFLVIALLLSVYLTKPITYLSKRMASRQGKNRVDNEKYLKRTDEVGVLYNEYNNLMTELDRSIKSDYQNKLIALDSQMKSLEAQINSHFLYNTLESINSIAEIEGIESISTMALALGNMFRYSIKTKSELVSIEDELSHVKDYVSIQRIRYSNQFELVVDIPPEMYGQQVLKLILQPLVENALLHGMDTPSRVSEIIIRGRMQPGKLVLQVIDNGPGIPPDRMANIEEMLAQEPQFKELGQRNKQSIGLKNIHSRIELYYGKGYGLRVHSQEGAGTQVQIVLPQQELDSL